MINKYFKNHLQSFESESFKFNTHLIIRKLNLLNSSTFSKIFELGLQLHLITFQYFVSLVEFFIGFTKHLFNIFLIIEFFFQLFELFIKVDFFVLEKRISNKSNTLKSIFNSFTGSCCSSILNFINLSFIVLSFFLSFSVFEYITEHSPEETDNKADNN